MEAVKEPAPHYHPFNSTLETGIRAVVVLDAMYPRQCDLSQLTWFDHLVVHTGDLTDTDAPESLHPDLPNRTGELLVRRSLVESGLRMMVELHLIDYLESKEGIFYAAGENAPSYLAMLKTDYAMGLKERANWMARHFATMTRDEIKAVIEARIGRWTAEFQAPQGAAG